MYPVSAEYLSTVAQGYTLHSRIRLLDEDDAPIEEISGEDGYVIDCAVTIDRTRLPRRMMSMTLANPGGLWTPVALAGKLWLNKKLSVEHGVQLPSGAIEWVPLGNFVVDRPRVVFSSGEQSLAVQGSDYWRRGARRKARQVVSLDKNMRLEQVVAELGPRAGFSVERMRLDDSDVLLGTNLVIPFGADLLDELQAIVADHAHEVYVDYDGWLVLRPAPRLCGATDCLDQPVVHLGGVDDAIPAFPLYVGEDALLMGVTKDWNDERLANAVIVTAEGAQRAQVSAEARDLNKSSPAYNPPAGYDDDWPDGGGPLGDRLMIVSTARLADDFACYQRAQQLLFENSLIEESYDLTLAPVAALAAGDTVTLQHPESQTDDTLLIDAISIGTTIESNQSLSIKKLRQLSPVA